MADEAEKERGGADYWAAREPDPSRLTTAALLREIANLKEVVFARLDAQAEAAQAFKDDLQRVPTALQNANSHVLQLIEEKFHAVHHDMEADTRLTTEKFVRVDTMLQDMARLRDEKLESVHAQFESVNQRFVERDVRTDKLAEAGGLALSAALQAAEKAVGKNELVTGKLLETQASQLQTETAGLRSQLADAKERITRIESQAIGQMGAKSEQVAHTGGNMNLAGIVIGILGLLVTVVVLLIRGAH